jgi:hypothetical protein
MRRRGVVDDVYADMVWEPKQAFQAVAGYYATQ